MANNRMWLVHKPSGRAILLAKYYPKTGWHTYHSQETVDSFFDTIEDRSLFGDTDLCLLFETDEVNKAELTGAESFPFNNPAAMP